VTTRSSKRRLTWTPARHGSFVFFGDPDGNRSAVQQLPARD
jgi:hypothetical protein